MKMKSGVARLFILYLQSKVPFVSYTNLARAQLQLSNAQRSGNRVTTEMFDRERVEGACKELHEMFGDGKTVRSKERSSILILTGEIEK